MRRYAFASTLFIVGGVALVLAVAMLSRAWMPTPARGVPPDRFTAKQKGPSLEAAVRAMGDAPEDAYEPDD